MRAEQGGLQRSGGYGRGGEARDSGERTGQMEAASGTTQRLASTLDRGQAFHVRRTASGPSGSAGAEAAERSAAMIERGDQQLERRAGGSRSEGGRGEGGGSWFLGLLLFSSAVFCPGFLFSQGQLLKELG